MLKHYNYLLATGIKTFLFALAALALYLAAPTGGLMSLLGFVTVISLSFYSLACFAKFGIQYSTVKISRFLDRRAHSE